MKTPQLQQAALRFRQFSRITVVMNARDDCQCLVSEAQFLPDIFFISSLVLISSQKLIYPCSPQSTGSQVLSAFDIVAAQPTSDKLFAVRDNISRSFSRFSPSFPLFPLEPPAPGIAMHRETGRRYYQLGSDHSA